VLKSRPRSIFGRIGDWLFSQRHFHLKLLSGTTVGVIVIIFLAGVFLLVTLRNHYQDTLRTHTIEVIRLSSLIENDIASLESGHRGFLLSGSEDYIAPFEKKRDLIKHRIEDLTALILDSPRQRKRVMKVQEVVQKWLETVATPEINARRSKGSAPTAAETNAAGSFALGNSLLDQARELLQSLQDEEQIVLNQRMHDQEWATQSAQILDFLPKLERSVVEMEKEKRDYLLTGENSFAEADKRAVADFYTYNGYLSILVANSPTQAQLLAEIRASVERWIGLLIISNSYGFILVRRQLAKLEGAETHIRSVIENILDGMITVDDGGVIRSMNPAAKKCSAVATAK
jgi:methyl-accepting chemotaxis protein